jgi:predicted DNA-binding protein (UPF0251 family)|tara:strand:+ start:173 stop:994 length:822 start_codon:yes stop_codon:yes gene_type:complete
MEQTTPKPRRGRKPNAKAVDTATEKKVTPAPKKKLKREDVKIEAREFESMRGQATYMLMQSGVTVYDEDMDMVREIRYCERENSIYKDEQNPSSVKTPVIFRMGKLFVPKSKPNLMKFMLIHPENNANGGGGFKIIDPVKAKTVNLDTEFLVNDAINTLRSRDLEDLISIAAAYNMNVDRPVAEIKHDLLIKAKADPKGFMDSFDNPSVAMKAKIRTAQKYNVIKVDPDAIRWFDTNRMIVSVPAGMDPIDVFTRYCLTEAAVPVVEEIDRQL